MNTSTALTLWSPPRFVLPAASRRKFRRGLVAQYLSGLFQAPSLVRWPRRELNQITRRWTAFDSFAALLDAEGGYRPSLGCTDPAKVGPLSVLADAYDASQGERGDPRRAMRWGAMAAVAGKEGVS